MQNVRFTQYVFSEIDINLYIYDKIKAKPNDLICRCENRKKKVCNILCDAENSNGASLNLTKSRYLRSAEKIWENVITAKMRGKLNNLIIF